MFSGLISGMYKTIKYTVTVLALVSFITMSFFTVMVISSDYHEKSSQLAKQYAQCLEIQIESSTKPLLLIKNSLLNDNIIEDSAELDTLSRIVRMAHPAIYEFSLSPADSHSETSFFNLSNGSRLEYTMPYKNTAGDVFHGKIAVSLAPLLENLELDSNIFLKNTSVYISSDNQSFFLISDYPGENSGAVDKEYLDSKMNRLASCTEIMDGEFYVYTLPETTFPSTVAVFLTAGALGLVVMLWLSFKLLRRYTGYTEKQLDRLISDMDEYILTKEEDNNA